jgi:recombination protein RecR
MHTPSSFNQLIDALRVFPGVGPKSAQRMAYHLLQYDQAGAIKLVQAIEKALATLTHCKACHTLCETQLCEICSDDKRDRQLLCIVEMPTDVLRIEQTLAYEGLYFVLMGRISPLDGMGPKDIHMQQLLDRACDGVVNEVILATNFTVEGEATAHYIAEILRPKGIMVSRIARGVPVGGELEHIDPGTLSQSLIERRRAK